MSDIPAQALLAPTCVLVDLDGTVMDSARGITSTLAEALTDLGLPVPPPAELLGFVGPPILDGLRDVVGLDADVSLEVLARYRVLYRDHGAFDAEPYPGIREALDVLRATLPLAIATSKPESSATRILEHFDLADRFVLVAGASDDETRSEKADVIAYALQRLDAAGIDTTAPVMVGDRSHDVLGAAANDVPALFAAWGYGAPEEAAGAAGTVDAPVGLPDALLPPGA